MGQKIEHLDLLEVDKLSVCDIIINHLDSYYHTKIIKCQVLIKILHEIQILKGCESNISAETIRYDFHFNNLTVYVNILHFFCIVMLIIDVSCKIAQNTHLYA